MAIIVIMILVVAIGTVTTIVLIKSNNVQKAEDDYEMNNALLEPNYGAITKKSMIATDKRSAENLARDIGYCIQYYNAQNGVRALKECTITWSQEGFSILPANAGDKPEDGESFSDIVMNEIYDVVISRETKEYAYVEITPQKKGIYTVKVVLGNQKVEKEIEM